MLQGRRMRKAVAAWLLFVFATETFAPAAAYALTSGPTSPEATSFEPIDTTDMVNLQTGDFTYNIPLLEVPGPEGGYPLSLSYHAGIQPNEDASWVGLGWTLNPGAINRSVNGYPDDWYNPKNNSHVYWAGGTTTTYTVGVSIGIANTPATVGFGLSISQDTYMGFGVGNYFSIGSSLGENSPFGIGVKMGVDAYGNGFLSGGVGASSAKPGENRLAATAGIGFSTNFESVNVGISGGIDYSAKLKDNGKSFQGSLLGASLNTGSNKPSLSVGGLSATVNSTKQAGIQTSSFGIGLDIPVVPGVLNLSLGYSKIRYWTDEKVDTYTHGSLYTSGWSEGPNHEVIDDRAFDTYSLLENPRNKNIIEYPDPTRIQGGAFLDYDLYMVTAQGLGGNMRPYLFQGETLGQNRKASDNTPLVTYYSPSDVTDPQPQFRFAGDFSNSFRQEYPMYPNTSLDYRFTAPAVDLNPVYGDNDDDDGYVNYKLAGSRHIDIGATVKPSNIYGYNKADRYKSYMIEGFSITNESGVTYHYALPAYSYNEEIYQEKIDRTSGLAFNRQTKGAPYAYIWYLTSITGPDFVDRDSDDKAGVNDWGYWVNFEYGKWSNEYVWRNPSEGYHRDEDNEWQAFSMGKKEVYYLNAIRTRSHVALFEKEPRMDGKGVSPDSYNTNIKVSFKSLFPPVLDTTRTDYLNAGEFDSKSSESLRLRRIYLLNAEDADIANVTASGANPYPVSSSCSQCKLALNVLDVLDLEAQRVAVESKAIRVIDFNSDYSLCSNTANSFSSDYPSQKKGKLTLKRLGFRGKGGTSLLPPIKFEYDLTGDDLKEQLGVSLSSSNFSTTNDTFEVGDLVMRDDGTFCGAITIKELSGSVYNYTLINSKYVGSTVTANIRATKNPPYNKDAYDIWGMYKSDINLDLLVSNENVGRRTSETSGKGSDVWSLRRIVTSLGTKVTVCYEPDSYRYSALNKNVSLIMKNITTPNNDRQTLQFEVEAYDQDINDFYQLGDKCNIVLMTAYSAFAPVPPYAVGVKIAYGRNDLGELRITQINGNVITGILDNAIQQQISVIGVTSNLTFGSILSGNLTTSRINHFWGGGIRVSSIKLLDVSNMEFDTKYKYLFPSLSDLSSGVTSFLPNVFDEYDRPVIALNTGNYYQLLSQSINYYRSLLYNDIHRLLSISREAPSPGVMYEYVTVTNEVKNPDETNSRRITGSTQFQFETFKENMVVQDSLDAQESTVSGIKQSVRNLALKKFTGSIGNIKRIVQFDEKGKKLSETINHYLHEGLEDLPGVDFMSQYKSRLSQFRYQGYLQERLSEVKRVEQSSLLADDGIKATFTAREEYPCIQTGQTVINYLNGTKVSSENLAFDFYSGAVTKTVETDAYGNRFMSKTIPAYRMYPSMGLKVGSSSNKNMLTQVAATYMYRVDDENEKQGLISAQIQTWGNGGSALDMSGNSVVQNGGTYGDVWRMQSSYAWRPVDQTSDGLTAMGNFSDFNWASPSSSHANWKKTGEITLYDVYSKGLEGMDINGNYSATRMSYGSKKVELTGSNANYYEMAYSGVEGDGVNKTNNVFVKKVDGTVSTAAAHTGVKSLQLGTGGKKGLVYTVATDKLLTSRPYTASVWVKPETGSASDVKLYYDINGTVKASASSSSSTKTADGWTLVTLSIDGADITSGQTLTVGCRNDHGSVASYVDDFRFQPVTASTTAYVYDPFSGELTYVLDNNNLYTAYEYDAVGRLIKTSREKLGVGKLKTMEYEYNMGQPYIPNDEMSEDFTRNCDPGFEGSVVTYTVPAGRYLGHTKALANQMAWNDIMSNGQTYADNNGTCDPLFVDVYYSVPFDRLDWYFEFRNTETYDTYYFYSNNVDYYEKLGTLPKGHYEVNVISAYTDERFEVTSCDGGYFVDWGGYTGYQMDVTDDCFLLIVNHY